jgi:hypothetical protein
MKKGGAKEKEEGTERGREEKDRGTGGELKQYCIEGETAKAEDATAHTR